MKSNKEALKITRVISSYLDEWAPQNISKNQGTLDNHAYAIREFLEYLEEEKGVTTHTLSHKQFEYENIESWKGWLLNGRRRCSPATVNNRICALRSFVVYLSKLDEKWKSLGESARDVTSVKTHKTHVEGISEEGVAVLLKQIDQSTRTGRRDGALFITQYDTACRISELRGLTIENTHLNESHPYIWVCGKGEKNRACHLDKRTAEYLRRHIAENHGPNPNPKHLVFYSPCGEPGLRRLSTDAVDKRLGMYAAKAHEICPEVPANLTSHQLRHARATHLIVNHKLNILAVSKMLGHSSIETTMRYLDFTAEDKAQAFAALYDENTGSGTEKLWINPDGSLKDICKPRGVKR